MKKSLLLLALAAGAAFGQYKMEPAGGPPADVNAAFSALLQKQGVKILAADGSVYCEVWFRTEAPIGTKSSDDSVTLPFPQGALLGVIHFPGKAQDRRGQPLQAGFYTMRYSQYPVNGDHQGVAPQRDFALLTRIADDSDPNATPAFGPLSKLSAKAAGTEHPAVLSIWSSTGDKFPNLAMQSEHDWVLDAKCGDQGISMIVAGKVEG